MSGIYIFLAVLPSIVFLFFILRVDSFNKEPAGLLIGLFIFGIIATIPAGLLESVFLNLNFIPGLLGLAISTFIIIALSEEYFKRLAVKIVAYKSKAYDERLDGIVYCVVASLGFATLENILYIIQFTDTQPYIWLARGLLAVPAHMLFGVTMGYYMSMSKFCNNPVLSKRFARLSLWLPVFFHGLYDFLVLSNNVLLAILVIPLMIFLWIYNIRRLKTYYKESKLASELMANLS